MVSFSSWIVEEVKRTIQKYMKHTRPKRARGQNWKTFLRHHAAEVSACDFLQVTDLFFRPLFAFFIIELKSRKADPCECDAISHRSLGRATTAGGNSVWTNASLSDSGEREEIRPECCTSGDKQRHQGPSNAVANSASECQMTNVFSCVCDENAWISFWSCMKGNCLVFSRHISCPFTKLDLIKGLDSGFPTPQCALHFTRTNLTK